MGGVNRRDRVDEPSVQRVDRMGGPLLGGRRGRRVVGNGDRSPHLLNVGGAVLVPGHLVQLQLVARGAGVRGVRNRDDPAGGRRIGLLGRLRGGGQRDAVVV